MCYEMHYESLCEDCKNAVDLQFEETDHGDQLAIQMSATFDDEKLYESAKKLSRMSVPEVIERLNQAVNRRE